ncbi:RNA polymerase sigma-70 factor [Seonamhaeicola algicola]|uniref:RNA polymerase sigma-70 factor n=1 Tax=Seonamhaeicola algicola TaxID=1719036 RepID=UPI00164C8BAF|nr:RNA polymerase sigma-70 factor [Seonamhaeicola algicola]
MPLPTKHITNAEFLLLSIKQGDCKSYKKLFDLYWESMFTNAKSIVGNDNNAKDIVQDIWVKLWQNRAQLDIKNFDAYIYVAVRNASFKFLKSKKFTRLEKQVINSLKLSVEPDVKKQIDFDEKLSVIKMALNNLPKRCAQIFELSRLKHYTNDEIAIKLGISKKSVENQISIATKSIKHTLTSLLSLLCVLLSNF